QAVLRRLVGVGFPSFAKIYIDIDKISKAASLNTRVTIACLSLAMILENWVDSFNPTKQYFQTPELLNAFREVDDAVGETTPENIDIAAAWRLSTNFSFTELSLEEKAASRKLGSVKSDDDDDSVESPVSGSSEAEEGTVETKEIDRKAAEFYEARQHMRARIKAQRDGMSPYTK
ncbi:hypothetical protein N9S30_00075, partial [bacterium]|nr:hypothetical protein [bacterium]